MLLAPLAKAAAAAGLWKPAPLDLSTVKLTKIMGTMEITGDALEAIGHGRKDAFEATLITYHQRLVLDRPRVERRISGISARNDAAFIFPYPRKTSASSG